VDRDGRIYQLVSDENRAWHAGECALRGVPTNMSSRSIGIEIVNDGGGSTPYTEAQYQSLEALVPYLAQTYNVPLENLVGHKDVAIPAGRKTDPSPNFDFARIRRAMEQALRKPITVRWLGRTLDCPVRQEDGKSYVPIRKLAESLGHSVGWDGRVLIDGRPITFPFRNDNGTTWAWVRDLASFMRLDVAWDAANQIITLSPQQGLGAQPSAHS
jgi:N-acetyl-anhydromuramyl-L-alanine amidase AmpD